MLIQQASRPLTITFAKNGGEGGAKDQQQEEEEGAPPPPVYYDGDKCIPEGHDHYFTFTIWQALWLTVMDVVHAPLAVVVGFLLPWRGRSLRHALYREFWLGAADNGAFAAPKGRDNVCCDLTFEGEAHYFATAWRGFGLLLLDCALFPPVAGLVLGLGFWRSKPLRNALAREFCSGGGSGGCCGPRRQQQQQQQQQPVTFAVPARNGDPLSSAQHWYVCGLRCLGMVLLDAAVFPFFLVVRVSHLWGWGPCRDRRLRLAAAGPVLNAVEDGRDFSLAYHGHALRVFVIVVHDVCLLPLPVALVGLTCYRWQYVSAELAKAWRTSSDGDDTNNNNNNDNDNMNNLGGAGSGGGGSGSRSGPEGGKVDESRAAAADVGSVVVVVAAQEEGSHGEDEGEHSLRLVAWKESFGVLCDLPFIALALVVILCFNWRGPALRKDVACARKKLALQALQDEGGVRFSFGNKRRVLVVKHLFLLLLDVGIALPLFLVEVATLYRLPEVLGALAAKWSVPLGSPPETPLLLSAAVASRFTFPEKGSPLVEVTGRLNLSHPTVVAAAAGGGGAGGADVGQQRQRLTRVASVTGDGAAHKLRVLGAGFWEEL
jgi:hypothetical protein